MRPANWGRALGGLALLVGACLSGVSCSFKAVSSGAPLATPPLAATLRISWWLDAHTRSPQETRALTVDRDQRLMRSELPVTLPAQVPERIELELTYPTQLAELRPEGVTLQAMRAGGAPVSIPPESVVVASRTNEQTVAVLELGGLRTYLTDGAEGALQLRILIQQPSGETPLTATLELRTPPALLQVTQGAVEEAMLSGFADAEVLRGFDLQGRRFSLLQVSRLRNLSRLPLEVSVPLSTDAVVHAKRRTYLAAQAGQCDHNAQTIEHTEALSDEVRLFALTDDLPKVITSLNGDPGAVRETTVRVEVGRDAFVGIYGSGADARSLAGGKYSPRKPGSVQLPDYCESHCSKMRTAADEFPLCWMHFRVAFGVSEKQIQNCMDCAGSVQAGCESCHYWETTLALYRRAGQNCLFCGELTQIGSLDGVPVWQAVPEWETSVVMGKFPVGDEDVAITLEATPSVAPLRVRVADTSASEDPQSRAIEFINQASNWRRLNPEVAVSWQFRIR